jgi:hypothetical protein
MLLGAGVLFVLLQTGGEEPIDMCDCIMEVLVNEFRHGKVFNDESTRILQLTLAAESTTSNRLTGFDISASKDG